MPSSTRITRCKISQRTRVSQDPKETTGPNSFSTQLTSALQEVNKLQATAEEETKAYQMGESNDVAAVMMAKHKASLGFESTLQVRNKLLSAYKDIMNMSV